MSAEIFVRTGPGETRYALTIGGILARQLVCRDGDTALLNAVYRGRIVKIHKGLNAAFVDIGTGQEGYLNAPDAQYFDGAREKPHPIGELFTEGAYVVAQVTREPSKEKGPKLTSRVSLTSPNFVLTPFAPGASISKKVTDDAQRKTLTGLLQQFVPDDLGVIARTAAGDMASDALELDLKQIVGDWSAVAQKFSAGGPPGLLVPPPDPVEVLLEQCPGRAAAVVVDDLKTKNSVITLLRGRNPDVKVRAHTEESDIFEVHYLQDQWANLYKKSVELPSGGTLHIEETAALTAIDVDSGGRDSSLSGEAYNMATNLEAAGETGRHIMLREISGQIVVDFLPLRSKDNRARLERALAAALGDPSSDSRLLGFTKMGLFEMTRRRGRRSFAEAHLEYLSTVRRPESLAYDILYQLERESRRHPGKGLRVHCAPEVVEVFNQDHLSKILRQLTRHLPAPVEFDAESGQSADIFEIEIVRG